MREEYIKYRMVRAKETFSDAVSLFEKKSWNSCINRLYYSAFYAAIALLLNQKMEVKAHNGVKRKLGRIGSEQNSIKKSCQAFWNFI